MSKRSCMGEFRVQLPESSHAAPTAPILVVLPQSAFQHDDSANTYDRQEAT